MPPARSLKRPGDGGDSASPADDGLPGSPKVKLPRLDRGTDNFSSVVKSKMSSYTRTGQACDRCKVRKIRCDALAEGCSPCVTLSLDCYVTDRVTNRTERRGYLQQLEREKVAMLSHIQNLEKLLQDNGVEVRPWEYPSYKDTYPPGVVPDTMGNLTQDGRPGCQWQLVRSVWVKGSADKQQLPSGPIARYSAPRARPPEGHLGVSSDSAPLSSIKGTTLSILGTTIDITSFDAPDMDEPPPGTPIGSPLYNKSMMSFMQSILNINPRQENVDLPSRQDAFTYAEWYFLMLSPFLPVLHKPSFHRLLTLIYDDPTFKPSTAELVIVHMVFATIYFQYGIRNKQEPEKYAQLNEYSNKHYHWCLSKFFDLSISQTTTTVQAIAMIVSHTRNFAKPGCSSTIAHFGLMKAIELNMHRAVKLPEGQTTLENEIRKRSFWAILAVMVTLNGRLGRPMPLSLEEFDVDFPWAIPDELLVEGEMVDASKIGRCEYSCGLMAYRSAPVYMDMYTRIYGVRRDPSKYLEVVRDLEAQKRHVLDNLPEELRPGSDKSDNSQVFVLYTQAIWLEFSLCLRHPSVCPLRDPKIHAENTRICEESAKNLLGVVTELVTLKSLDTTWYQLAVYIAAIFTMLVAHWERRFDTNPDELRVLKVDMAQWLSNIVDIGRLLGSGGSGTRIADNVGTIIERTIGWIEHDMNHKAGTPSTQPAATQQAPQMLGSNTRPSAAGTPVDHRGLGSGATSETYYDSGVGGSTTSYPTLNFVEQPGAPHPNGNGTGVGNAQDPGGSGYLYSAPSGPGPASAAHPVVSPTGDQSASASNPLIAFASQATQHVTAGQAGEWAPQANMMAHPTGNSWNEWTAAIAGSQDEYSANALLTLGAPRPSDGAPAGDGHAGQWPLLLFHDKSTGS
ncbi:transcriptional activator protein acu-15 [Podospora conica]|nr:transcriptional activator protein acu-15 [Schizothecium conicum]